MCISFSLHVLRSRRLSAANANEIVQNRESMQCQDPPPPPQKKEKKTQKPNKQTKTI